MRISRTAWLIPAAAIAVTGIGLYYYFKPMQLAENRKTDISVSDIRMMEDFDSPAVAEAKYRNKVIELSGTVKKSEVRDSTVNFIFDKGGSTVIVATFNHSIPQISNTPVKLKGAYTGFIQGDDVFGTPSEIKIDQCAILP
jgi:hypothetical protein